MALSPAKFRVNPYVKISFNNDINAKIIFRNWLIQEKKSQKLKTANNLL